MPTKETYTVQFNSGVEGHWNGAGTVEGYGHDDAMARYFEYSANHASGEHYLVTGKVLASDGRLLDHGSAVEYVVHRRFDNGEYPYWTQGPHRSFDYFWLRRQAKQVFPEWGTYREIRDVEPNG